jgi:hypothetical protein
MRFLWPSLLGVCFTAACSGGTHQIEIGAPPAKMTQGTFSGPLCTGAACTCRNASAAGDGGAGVPTDGTKRFEIRMTSPQQLWMKVRDNSMYKSPERPEECFYIDLPVGESEVELRASEPNGVAGEWSIKELGTQTKSWYDTFTFNCGQPGVCSFDELREKKAEYGDPKRDRCGSVKIKGLVWDTGRSPDQLHPSELAVKVTLNVYKFVPDRPHGDDCSKKQAEEHSEDNPKM